MELIANIAQWIGGFWSIASAVLYAVKNGIFSFKNRDQKLAQLIYFIYHEIRPFYPYLLPFMIFDNMVLDDGPYLIRAVVSLVAVGAWFMYKNLDDDDRWKKRKAKLKESVKVMGSKLVVEAVPINA